MKLIAITVSNYRIHKDVKIEFAPGVTLITGGNEFGKSTLIEAVHHALFLRSKVSEEMAKALSSKLYEGRPQVELTFEVDGRRYKITKQFADTRAASATLSEVGGDTCRDREAEEKLHQLCQASEISGGRGLVDRIRSQWAHLWVWQGSAGLDPLDAANEAGPHGRLRERLGQLEGGGVLASPLDNEAFAEVSQRHAAIFGLKGAVKKESQLHAAHSGLDHATAVATAAAAALATLQSAVEDMDAADTAIARSDKNLAPLHDEIAEKRRRLAEVGSLRILEAEQKHLAGTAEKDYHDLRTADAEITANEAHIARLTEQMAPANQTLLAAGEEEQACNARFTAALEAATAAGRQHDAAARLADLYGLYEQLERLKVERVGLGGRCAKIRELQEEVTALRARRQQIPDISDKDIAALSAFERQRDNAESTLTGMAARIELVAGDQPVHMLGRMLAPGAAEIITTATDLTIGAGTCLRIQPGGGRSLEEATRQCTEAAANLGGRLLALGFATIEEARQASAARQALEAEIGGKEGSIRDLAGDAPQRKLEMLEQSITTTAARIEQQSPEGFTPPADLEAAVRGKQQVDTESDALMTGMASANAQVAAARQFLDNARAAKRRAEDAIHAQREEIQSLQLKRDMLVGRHGSDRAGSLRERERASQVARETYAETCRRLAELQPEILQQDEIRLEQSLVNLRSQKQAAETKKQIAKATLQFNGSSDPKADLEHATVAHRLAEAKHLQARQEAEAVGLLKRLFEKQQAAVAAQFAAPLASRVADYLRPLYGNDTSVAVEYRDGRFNAVTISRPALGNVPFSFAQLSGGGREQVAAAFRLAMAEILAEDHGGCLPVVFDDAFVNSDPGRIRDLHRVLHLGATRGLQIVVLSSNADNYATLGATTVVALPKPTAGAGLPAVDGAGAESGPAEAEG